MSVGRGPGAPASVARRGFLRALALFATAAGLRVAYAWLATGPGSGPTPDAAACDAVAWSLARGAGFSLNGVPTALVPPVLPWVAGLLYRAVGHDYFAAVLLGCLPGALVPLALSALATRTFGGSVGRVAGWLAAFDPLLVRLCGHLVPQATAAVLLLLALTASVEWVKAPLGGRALGTGIAWGLAALAGPEALALPVVVAGWAWVPLGLTLPAGARPRQVALLLVGLAAAMGPWALRNAVVLHVFVPVATAVGSARPAESGLVLLVWTAAAVALALWGLVVTLRGPRRWFLSLSLWGILCFAALGALTSGVLPMRASVEPLLVLFTAAGLTDAWRRLRARRGGLRVVRGGAASRVSEE